MNLKDAAANLNQAHPEDILHPLFTPWGEMIMRSGSYDDILSEYPRPQMRRTCLLYTSPSPRDTR